MPCSADPRVSSERRSRWVVRPQQHPGFATVVVMTQIATEFERILNNDLAVHPINAETMPAPRAPHITTARRGQQGNETEANYQTWTEALGDAGDPTDDIGLHGALRRNTEHPSAKIEMRCQCKAVIVGKGFVPDSHETRTEEADLFPVVARIENPETVSCNAKGRRVFG